MRQLAVFAKHWTPGLAKTRLAAHVGPERAAAIYRACLETTLRRFDHCGDRRDIVFTPRDMEDEFRALTAGRWRVVPQTAGDLGNRMAAYAERAFTSAARAVVFLGADSPTLPTSIIELTFDLLKQRPVVLGAAADGGYYLLGVSRPKLPIYLGISWGTDQVLQQTVARLKKESVNYSLLTPWYDVDDDAGLARLREELATLPADERTWAVLRDAICDL